MESFVFYEYYFLLFISVTVALAGFVFEIRTFYLTRREQKIDLLVATLFAEKIEEIDQYFPQKYRTLSVIIPALEKIQHKITNPYWDFFKEHILHHLIQKEIDLFLSSSSWKQTTLGLRALQLAPLPAYQSRVLSLLADSNDIVRFQAVRTAVALNTYTATKALIVTMLQMSPIMQFPYRDALSSSPQSVHEFVLQMYRTSKRLEEQIGCLKILSMKAGLLSEEEIIECISSDNLEKKWWGIFALGNNPYKRGMELLAKVLQTPVWQLQSIAAFTAGVLQYNPVTESLYPLLSNERYWVRFTAAAALHQLGETGISLLKKAQREQSELAKNIATYMLLIPEDEFKKGIRSFFPLNLDTVLLDEEINTSLS